VAAALVALASRLALAQTSPSDVPAGVVAFRAPPCPTEARSGRFVQLLAIELASARIQLVQDGSVPFAAMAVETDGGLCDPNAREVAVVLSHSGSRAIATIDVADVEPGARLRALALATAELVRTALQRIATEPPRAGATAEPARSPENVESTKVTDPPHARETRTDGANARADVGAAARGNGRGAYRADVHAVGTWRFFAPESTRLVGFGLGAGLRLRPEWLSLRADVMAAFASIDDALGAVGLATYGGALSLLATTGATPELEIGPRFELAYARAAGAASGPGSLAAVEGRPIALAAISAGARFWGDRWALSAHVDTGATLAGAEIFADARRIAAISGFFAGVRAGLAFGF
jgi:hypothetical protein